MDRFVDGRSVGLAVWRWRQRELFEVLDVDDQLLLLLMLLLASLLWMMQCAGGTAEPWRRHAVRRLTERHLRPGTSSAAARTSSHSRRQHEVDRQRKYDGGVLFSGDLRHGLKVAQLQSVGWFVDDVRRLLERVRRFLLAFRCYNLRTIQRTCALVRIFNLNTMHYTISPRLGVKVWDTQQRRVTFVFLSAEFLKTLQMAIYGIGWR